MSAIDLAAEVLIGLGTLVLVLAALGLWTLPDALSRQHAGTKAVTLGLALLAAGAALLVRESAWTGRLALLAIVLFATVPLASHLLARAAVEEARGRSSAVPREDR